MNETIAVSPDISDGALSAKSAKGSVILMSACFGVATTTRRVSSDTSVDASVAACEAVVMSASDSGVMAVGCLNLDFVKEVLMFETRLEALFSAIMYRQE